MRTALALSPHLDDAAFSAGGTLARLARRGWRVVVTTVFTRSVPNPTGFALACQTDKGLPPDADYMAIRRAEDEVACAALGAEPLHLPHEEAPHRGYDDAPALFAGLRSDDEAVLAVRRSLETLITQTMPDLVLAPRAIGAHVDHIVVREALFGLGFALPHTFLWTDWPYAGRANAPNPYEEPDAGARNLFVPVRDLPAKLDACAAYATQLGFQFGGEAAMRDALTSEREETFLRVS